MTAFLFLVGGCLLMAGAFRRMTVLGKRLDAEPEGVRAARFAAYGTSPQEREVANQTAFAMVVGFAGSIVAFIGVAALGIPALYWLIEVAQQ